ncbi:hypothetical protein BH10BAC4_BH10BAC4_16230 [soil metagenome]
MVDDKEAFTIEYFLDRYDYMGIGGRNHSELVYDIVEGFIRRGYSDRTSN